MKMVFWSWFVGVMSLQFRLWKRRVLLHSLCNSREVLRWIRSQKKWEDEWQKLPYISPYEDASHLLPNSDESDKWTVAVLHELLHILVPKKTERDNLLLLGEYLGLQSRFKRALLQHPGIFYMSTKIGTYTVVLKEGYKRGLLVEDHPWMQMRNRYIHLMNMVKEDGKLVSVLGGSNEKKRQTVIDEKEKGEEDESGEEYEGASSDSSDAEVENARDDEYDDDEDENKSQRGVRKNVAGNRGKKDWKMNSDVKGHSRNYEIEREAGKRPRNSKEEFPSRTNMHDGNNVLVSSRERSSVPKCRGRLLPGKRTSTS